MKSREAKVSHQNEEKALSEYLLGDGIGLEVDEDGSNVGSCEVR